MQVEGTRLYRVRAVAGLLDVSVYRAVESGSLRALRVGTGKGALRVPGSAIAEYVQACERAAAGGQGEAYEAGRDDPVVMRHPEATRRVLDIAARRAVIGRG